MNNASIARFHSSISSIQQANPTNKIDMGAMLQSFKEVESSYLFKPEIASGVGTVDKNAQTREYVRQAGQKEFDDLKKMVDHFKNKSISRGQLLDKFDTDNVRPRGFDSGKAQSYQIELSTAYTQVLTSKKGKSSAVSSHQSSKQRQDLVDRLASDIGENMSRKIFTGHYNQENKEAIVNHLKEYILPTLSDKELSQSTQNVEQIVGRVVNLNDSGWARKVVQERGQEGLAQYYSDHAMSPSGSDNLSQKKLSKLEPNKINSIISHALSPSQSQIMSKL